MTEREGFEAAWDVSEYANKGPAWKQISWFFWKYRGEWQKSQPIKLDHVHGWFSTGAMKPGQYRCITCGQWGQEEIPPRSQLSAAPKEPQDG